MISIGEHGRVSFGRKADIQWKQDTCFHCNMDLSFATRVLQAKWHGRDLHTKTIHTQLCSDGVCKTRVLHEIYIYPKFLVVGSPASWSHPSSTPLMSLSFSLWKTRHWKLLIFGSATHFQSSSIEWQSCLNHHQSCSLLELQIDGHTAAANWHQFHRQYISHFQELSRRSCLTKARKMFRLYLPSCSSYFLGSFNSDSYCGETEAWWMDMYHEKDITTEMSRTVYRSLHIKSSKDIIKSPWDDPGKEHSQLGTYYW